MGMLLLVLLLNFAISWFNCWSVGRIWNEARALGGWVRVLCWCGAIQSAVGFSSVVGFAVGAVLSSAGYLPPAAAKAAMSLWYVLVIFPVLGTGLIITIESWIAAYRERSLLNMGSAAYNTFAMWHNASGAIDGIGSALGQVTSLFKADLDGDDSASTITLIVVGLVLCALLSGVLLTSMLIRRYAGTIPLPSRVTA